VPFVKKPLAKNLIKISVRITAEAEDAVLELLGGVFGRPASIYADTERHTTSAIIYVEKFTAAQRALVRDGLRRIREAGIDIGSGRISVRRVPRENWAESWKRHFHPLEIGPRLLVLPSWSKQKPKRGQAVVILDPGLSFGTGHHPTTAFCLAQVAARREDARKQRLLDAGCGSGILAIAAAKLGYSPVVAFDFDPEAVRVAKENAQANRVSFRIAQQDLTKMPRRSTEKFDVVCANLIYDLLIQERDRILARLAPGGTLVLAGILRPQFPKVQRAFEMAGLRLVASRAAKEWRSGAFQFLK
jgi:ribosomal protein L11 methyltransferase